MNSISVTLYVPDSLKIPVIHIVCPHLCFKFWGLQLSMLRVNINEEPSFNNKDSLLYPVNNPMKEVILLSLLTAREQRERKMRWLSVGHTDVLSDLEDSGSAKFHWLIPLFIHTCIMCSLCDWHHLNCRDAMTNKTENILAFLENIFYSDNGSGRKNRPPFIEVEKNF